MSHVFISYSRHDSEYVEKLVEKLRAEGFTVWFDKQTDYGDEWWRTIVRALRECGAVIVVMTPSSGESRWVERELIFADNQKKRIFPLLLEGDLDSSETWALFGHTQFVDVRDKSLPPLRFYDTLARHATRTPNRGQIITPAPVEPPIQPLTITESPALITPETPKIELPPPPDVSTILPPPFEWCYIPAGKVTIEYRAWESGNYVTSRKDFKGAAFYMAKYPITNAQFEMFVKAKDGYADSRWWDYSDQAKAWRTAKAKSRKSTFDGDDCPRTDVTWYEAVAFCCWLDRQVNTRASHILPLEITLPTVHQWQYAAQGDDGRIYPWGNDFDPSRCNTLESDTRRTTPVRKYPTGASTFGIMDMAGNVREWTRTTEDHNSGLTGNSPRIIRGSSWNDNQAAARLIERTSFFDASLPIGYNNSIGFRLVAAVPLP